MNILIRGEGYTEDGIINMLEFLVNTNFEVFEGLPGPDISRLTRDQRHDREQHFCFLPGFTSVDREGRSTSHFHL